MGDEPVAVRGYLEAADTRSTLDAVRALGALVEERPDEIVIRGSGLREARETEDVIDVGNAGTLMRLLPGWLAAQEGRSFTLDGDASIRRRPVDRIAEPLERMGASLEARDDRFPPFTIRGARLRAVHHDLAVASAQVKSCVLLAGLAADGATTVSEPHISRDHTERMLAAAGVTVHRNGRHVTLINADELVLERIDVPGDASSAAFLVAAGLLVPHSRLLLRNATVNGTGRGSLRTVGGRGGIVAGARGEPTGGGSPPYEPVSELDVTASPLVGTEVTAEEVPLAIDELPLVALL